MQVIWQGHPSYRGQHMIGYLIRAVLFVIFVGLIAVAAAKFAGLSSMIAGAAIAGAVLIGFGMTEILRRNTTYIVTTSGVRCDSGILTRRREEMSYRKLQSTDITQNLLERFVLKTGTIQMGSASNDDTLDDILFAGIVNPHVVADTIRQAEQDDRMGPMQSRMPTQGGYPQQVQGRFGDQGGSQVPAQQGSEQGGGNYSGWVDPNGAPPQGRPGDRGYRPGDQRR